MHVTTKLMKITLTRFLRSLGSASNVVYLTRDHSMLTPTRKTRSNDCQTCFDVVQTKVVRKGTQVLVDLKLTRILVIRITIYRSKIEMQEFDGW